MYEGWGDEGYIHSGEAPAMAYDCLRIFMMDFVCI